MKSLKEMILEYQNAKTEEDKKLAIANLEKYIDILNRDRLNYKNDMKEGK